MCQVYIINQEINQECNRCLGINCCHWSHEESNGEGGFKQEIDEDISRVSSTHHRSNFLIQNIFLTYNKLI